MSDPTPSRLAWPLAWLPAALYMALIFTLSSISQFGQLPVHVSDKLAHAVLYAGFGVTLSWGLTAAGRRQLGWKLVVATTLLSFFYGVSDEFHQRFVPGRSFEIGDMVADMTGGFLGALAVWLWQFLRRNGRSLSKARGVAPSRSPSPPAPLPKGEG